MYSKLQDARNRVICKFVMILIICFCVYGTYVTYNVYHNILKNNYENINSMVDVTIENLNQTFELIRGTTIALSGSDSVENWINDQSYFSNGNKESSLNKQELNREIQKILTNTSIWSFELFDYITIYQNEELLAYTYTKPFRTKQIIEETGAVYERIRDNSDYALTLPPSRQNKSMYTTLRIQADFSSDNSLFIIGATKEGYLREKLENSVACQGAVIYLINKEGIIYSSNKEEQLGQVMPVEIANGVPYNDKALKKYNGVKYIVITRNINKEFSFVYLLPKSELVKQTFQGMSSFLFISLLIMTLLIVVAVWSTLRATAFIKDFSCAIRRVRDKDYDTKMERYDNPALDELVDTFNLMTEEINSLIKITYESKLLLNEMKLKSLQHQMNPHFLFNILLTIQIKAKMSGNETVYRMIASLSSLLRAGIYEDTRLMITIGEELKYVDYYLSLQKERYEDRLTYSIDIQDESILQCKIPRLIIEPLAENAIVHGIETKTGEAYVHVTLYFEGDNIVIHVIDNGVGFDVSAVAEGSGQEQGGGEIRRERMGLSNTRQRLKLLYGERCVLNIHSEKHKGTDIEIRIPREVAAL